MAMVVVDLLEVIQVEHDQRQRCLCAMAAQLLALERLLEASTVGQAGERISLRLRHQARLGLLAGNLINMGKHQDAECQHTDIADDHRLHDLRVVMETPEKNQRGNSNIKYGHRQAVASAKQQVRSEEHTSELQSRENIVCRL